MMISDHDIPEGCGGFIIVLYMLFHVKDVNNHPAFDEASAINLNEKYSDDKVTSICEGLQWAINHRQYNYKDIFPGMRFSNDEILFFFEKTLKEMKSVGFCK